LHDADAGRHEQQRESTQQPVSHLPDRAGLQTLVGEGAEAVPGREAGYQQRQAEDWSGHGQTECAGDRLAGQLAQQQDGEASDHGLTLSSRQQPCAASVA
jgi:hypothetical protein